MNIEEKVCARTAPHPDGIDNGCQNTFVSKKHNQIFCNAECTRIQTNANIMEKYYERKRRESGAERICSVCNFTKLSRYNEDSVCASCVRQPEVNRSEQAKRMIEGLTNGVVVS